MPKCIQEFTFEPFLELLKEVRERVRQAWTNLVVEHSKKFFMQLKDVDAWQDACNPMNLPGPC